MPRTSRRGSSADEDFPWYGDEADEKRQRRRRKTEDGSGKGRQRRPRYDDDLDWDDDSERVTRRMIETDDADLPLPEDWDDDVDWEDDDVSWKGDGESDRRPEDEL